MDFRDDLSVEIVWEAKYSIREERISIFHVFVSPLSLGSYVAEVPKYSFNWVALQLIELRFSRSTNWMKRAPNNPKARIDSSSSVNIFPTEKCDWVPGLV